LVLRAPASRSPDAHRQLTALSWAG